MLAINHCSWGHGRCTPATCLDSLLLLGQHSFNTFFRWNRETNSQPAQHSCSFSLGIHLMPQQSVIRLFIQAFDQSVRSRDPGQWPYFSASSCPAVTGLHLFDPRRHVNLLNFSHSSRDTHNVGMLSFQALTCYVSALSHSAPLVLFLASLILSLPPTSLLPPYSL